MMTQALKPIAQHSLAHGSFSTSYVDVGDALPDGTKALLFVNDTDGTVQLSLDGGTTDAFPLPASTTFFLPLRDIGLRTLNSQHTVAVKDIDTPTEGSVYVGIFI